MKILIIEDDPNKAGQLMKFLEDKLSSINIKLKKSYKSGLKELLRDDYDLILLDMSMPTFDITIEESGGKPLPFAGKEILRQMKRRNVTIPAIIVTQFESFGEAEKKITLDKLKNELSQEFSRIYIGTIYYNPAGSDWQNLLLNLILPIIGTTHD